jgi:DNA-binding XRE family transcriptional regulator
MDVSASLRCAELFYLETHKVKPPATRKPTVVGTSTKAEREEIAILEPMVEVVMGYWPSFRQVLPIGPLIGARLKEFLQLVACAIFHRVITPAQSRAARGLLEWSQQKLAQRAQVGVVTVHQLEAGTSEPRRATVQAIRRAFELAGVEFIDENGGGPGVRLKKRQQKKTT